MSKFLTDPTDMRIDYLGLEPEAGALPAFFYFALSGEDSLELHPYSQPAKLVGDNSCRIFSFTIPGHEPGMNKFNAMQYWAEQMLRGEYLLENFFEKVVNAIHWLIEQKIADPSALATGGLSRGGFVATHIAARVNQLQTVLGFAPLIELMQLKEFADHPELRRRSSELDLVKLVDRLTHVRHFRFYIGNLDTRVGTDACYHFIRRLAEAGHAKQARHQKVELFITHSIGHKGHGTDPHIFEEGSSWLKHHLTIARGLM
jgi:predicted esterase